MKLAFVAPVAVVPALGLLWLANFVDRSNAGNARIAGLDRDLSLTGHQFSTALAVFVSERKFIKYIPICSHDA